MKTLACLVGVIPVVASCTNPTLTVTELGTSLPQPSAVAWDISDSGRIAGAIYLNNQNDAVEFEEDGGVVVLPRPPGYTQGNCQATAVNDAGLIAGACWRVDENGEYSASQAVFWDATGTAHEFIASKPDRSSSVVDMNNHGIILGHNVTDGEFAFAPWIYDTHSATLTELPVVPSIESSRTSANAINDAGDIVGMVSSGQPQNDRAIKWSASSLTISYLPTPPDCNSQARAINNRGVIAGAICYPLSDLGRAAIWSSAAAQPEMLPAPPPISGAAVGAIATDVSDNGVVIGVSGRYAQRSYTQRPIGWTADRRLIDFGVIYPAAINASGVIVGQQNGKAVRVTIQ
ncbi:MAG TPA: hypothetical protein VI072_13875 [Polyangiaceae bacterium]